MDYAKEKYDNGIVEDVKCLLRVLWMYLPLPMFWALFDQLVKFTSPGKFDITWHHIDTVLGIPMDLPSHTDEWLIGSILD